LSWQQQQTEKEKVKERKKETVDKRIKRKEANMSTTNKLEGQV
jgi:hypothetical protein